MQIAEYTSSSIDGVYFFHMVTNKSNERVYGFYVKYSFLFSMPGLSLEAAMLGASQPRNEKLAALFYRMKLIEAYGTGFCKNISCYKGIPIQPKFKNVEGAFQIVLPNVHAKKFNTEEKYLPILKLFENQKEISRSDTEHAWAVVLLMPLIC